MGVAETHNISLKQDSDIKLLFQHIFGRRDTHINVVFIDQRQGQIQSIVQEIKEDRAIEAMEKLLDALPGPDRYEQAIELIHAVAVRKFEQKQDAAEWLGVNRTTFYERARKMGLFVPKKRLYEKIIEGQDEDH